MICDKCKKGEMYAKRVDKQVSLSGILSVLIVMAGLVTLLFSAVLGVLIVIAGLILSAMGRGKNTFLVCPACKHKINV